MEPNEAADLLKTSIFFKGALEDRIAKGPSSPVYRLLEKQLRKRSDKQLTRRLYLAVADHVTLVTGSGLNDDLVTAIFSFDYCLKDGLSPEAEGLRGAFEVAARSLVSANATLAAPCLRSLAKALQGVAYAAANGPLPQPPGVEPPTHEVKSDDAATAGDKDDVPSSKSEVLAASLAARVVGMVIGVVGAVPTAGASLIGCYFAEYFPHRFRDERCLVVYARGVLEVARRLPRLSGDLVALLVDRCLEIDVEIKLDEFGNAKLTGAAAAAGGAAGGSDSEGDEDDEEEEEDPMLLGFGASLGNRKAATPSGAAPSPAAVSSESSPAAAAALLTAPLAVDEMASKLDGLMLELFKHLDHVLLPKKPLGDHDHDSEVHYTMPAPTGSRSSSAPDLARVQHTNGGSNNSQLTPSMSSPSLHASLEPPTKTVSSSFVAWGAEHDDAAFFSSMPNHPLKGGSPRSPVGYPSSSPSPPRHQLSASSPENDASLRLWQALHGAFESQVLLTHRSKFVQFLLLRFVHLAPQHGPTFAARLLQTATDKRVPHVRRVNAVHYLASFLVRAKALPRLSLIASIEGLLAWCESELPYEEAQHRARQAAAARDPSSSASALHSASASARKAQPVSIAPHSSGLARSLMGDRLGSASSSSHSQGSSSVSSGAAAGLLDPSELGNHRLGVFYAATQALFYVFCFKGRQLRAWAHDGASVASTTSTPGDSTGTGAPSVLCSVDSVTSAPPDLAEAAAAAQQEATATCHACRQLVVPERWRQVCESPLQPLTLCLERVRGEFIACATRQNSSSSAGSSSLSSSSSLGPRLLPLSLARTLEQRAVASLRELSSAAGLQLSTHQSSSSSSSHTPHRGGAQLVSSSATPSAMPPPRTPGRFPPSAAMPGALQPSQSFSAPTPVTPRALTGHRTPGRARGPPIQPPSAVSAGGHRAHASNTPSASSGRVSSVSGVGTFNRANPLESFFPFDPYLLRFSHKYVRDIYFDWEPPPEDEDEWGSEDEDEDEEEDDDEGQQVEVDEELEGGKDDEDDDDEEDDDDDDDEEDDSHSSASSHMHRNSLEHLRGVGSEYGRSLGSASAMSVDSRTDDDDADGRSRAYHMMATSPAAKSSAPLSRPNDDSSDDDDASDNELDLDEDNAMGYHNHAEMSSGGHNGGGRNRADSIGDW